MTRLPTERDLAVTPELAILAALRVALQLAIETLRVIHPLDDPPVDPEQHAAHVLLLFAEALRLAVLDYETKAAGRF